MIKKLAVISTHPIQYYAPVFKLLSEHVTLKVFYTWGEESLNKHDRGFGQQIKWDIDLLEGYDYKFLENIANEKGTHHFWGIKNPDALGQISSFKPDAILIYGWAWWSHLKIIYHFHGKVPVLFRGDSILKSHQQGIKSIAKTFFLKWVYSNIDVAFYVGSANKAYFKAYGLKEEQLIFAPHAIDNERFSQGAVSPNQLRKSLQISDDDILVLFAGKLDPVKNPLLLLSAFKALKRENVHLLLVGNGLLEKEIKQVVSDEKIQNVHFLGFQNQSQMPSVYKCCDLFCLPSISETWGLAVNEAMASSKAILVSDQVGCSADLVNSNVGRIFKSGNLADLTQKLIALTSDKQQLLELGKGAFLTLQNWSFERQVNAITTYVNR